MGKNPPSVPLAAERMVAAQIVALVRNRSLDSGHQACTPCIGRAVPKVRLHHTSESSNVAVLEDCIPAYDFRFDVFS
jgi:hypothetical protein